MLRIGRPLSIPITRRVAKLRPSKSRTTRKMIGSSSSPGRMK
jgi:hypothetical protein